MKDNLTPAGLAAFAAVVLGWLGVRDPHIATAVQEVVAGGAFLVGAVFVHGHHKVKAALASGQAQIAAAGAAARNAPPAAMTGTMTVLGGMPAPVVYADSPAADDAAGLASAGKAAQP